MLETAIIVAYLGGWALSTLVLTFFMARGLVLPYHRAGLGSIVRADDVRDTMAGAAFLSLMWPFTLPLTLLIVFLMDVFERISHAKWFDPSGEQLARWINRSIRR